MSKRKATADTAALRQLPSVDEVLRTSDGRRAAVHFGRGAVVGEVRAALAAVRKGAGTGGGADQIALRAFDALTTQARPSLRRVFNLTGTVLHTNLGRALL